MSSFYIIVIRIVIVMSPTTIESPKDFFLSEINKTIIDAISSMLEKLKFKLLLSVKIPGHIKAAKIPAGINFIHSISQFGSSFPERYTIGKLRGI